MPPSFAARFVVLALLTVVPFCRFLLLNHYGPFHPETEVALGCLFLASLVLAAAGRWRWVFCAQVSMLVAVLASVPIQRLITPLAGVPLFLLAGGVALAAGAALILMREEFFTVLLTFAAGFLLVDVIQQAVTAMPSPDKAVPAGKAGPGHVLYLVLDEQMGPGGLPRAIPAAGSAARRIEEVFSRHHFRLYRNAFSNYTSTLDSVPSILNCELLSSSHELVRRDPAGIYHLRRNRLFDLQASRGYGIRVVQYRPIDYTAGEVPVEIGAEYWDSLGALADADGPWMEKFQWIVGNYQRSDRMTAFSAGLFPFRFRARTAGPLSVGPVWPAGLAQQIAGTQEKTLFFAHVLTPHRPYVFDRNGRVRDFASWSNDDDLSPRGNPEAYRDLYTRYSEQVEYLCGQLDWLFGSLERAGLFDSMRVVVHGDHGSRIRLLAGSGAREGAGRLSFDLYDYDRDPALQDVRDRFSALLAIKEPGSKSAEPIDEPGTVLGYLQRDFYRAGRAGTDADSLVLFDAAGAPRKVATPHAVVRDHETE